ncbi:serpin family protein [Candidatus Woesearchaeota archaeon]|nr:serpin family protein [Candidatus Woesearchaeota archaeon]MBW3006278.1 serpin family protein [Candidatus Woesearchaeota archaeon]
MKYQIIVPLLILSMLLLGCAPEIEIPTTDDTGATAEGVAELVKANNQFGIDIYDNLSQTPGNVFISPWSLASALSMTYEGARGQTADEMKDVLHLPDAEVRHSSFAKLFNDINKKDKDYQLYTANALWAQKDYPFLPEYMNLVEKYYAGKATNVDFAGNTEQARLTINKWVEDHTNNKIKELFEPGILSSMTRLVLTNAIYFKGNWAKQFDKSATHDADFKVDKDTTVQVDMMSMHDEDFNYYEDDTLQVLEMPYEGDELSMMVLLPKEGLEKIESTISAENIDAWRNSLHQESLDVYMPKFTFETKYGLVGVLKKLGMPTACSMDADFSGMDGSQILFIHSVIHQAFVEVNEEGTEAAAATGVEMAFKAMPMVKTFRADHPFIFLIQERNSGNILFMGRVVDPS